MTASFVINTSKINLLGSLVTYPTTLRAKVIYFSECTTTDVGVLEIKSFNPFSYTLYSSESVYNLSHKMEIKYNLFKQYESEINGEFKTRELVVNLNNLRISNSSDYRDIIIYDLTSCTAPGKFYQAWFGKYLKPTERVLCVAAKVKNGFYTYHHGDLMWIEQTSNKLVDFVSLLNKSHYLIRDKDENVTELGAKIFFGLMGLQHSKYSFPPDYLDLPGYIKDFPLKSKEGSEIDPELCIEFLTLLEDQGDFIEKSELVSEVISSKKSRSTLYKLSELKNKEIFNKILPTSDNEIILVNVDLEEHEKWIDTDYYIADAYFMKNLLYICVVGNNISARSSAATNYVYLSDKVKKKLGIEHLMLDLEDNFDSGRSLYQLWNI